MSKEEIQHFGMNNVVAVKLDAKSKTRLRFVTNVDVTLEDVKLTIEKLKYVFDLEYKISQNNN